MKKPICRFCLFCLTFSLYALALFWAADAEAAAPDTLEQTLLVGVQSEAEVIPLSHLSPLSRKELAACYSTLYATNPSLFYLSHSYVVGMEGDTPVYVRPVYRYTGEERAWRQAKIDAWVDKTISDAGSALTQETYLAHFHDTIIESFSYDESKQSFDAWSLLDTGKGVCQAYALLFQALCDRAGILCECVPAFEQNHEWNRVCLNGAWLHLDLTWDEAASTQDLISYTYFLISEHPNDACQDK